MEEKILQKNKKKSREKSSRNHKSVFANHKDLVDVMEQV